MVDDVAGPRGEKTCSQPNLEAERVPGCRAQKRKREKGKREKRGVVVKVGVDYWKEDLGGIAGPDFPLPGTLVGASPMTSSLFA